MLGENKSYRREQSALERRVAMGLDTQPEPDTEPEVDVKDFMVDEDIEVTEESADE